MSVPGGRTSWFRMSPPNPAAGLRLICLPHGGGGTAAFRGWASGLPATIEVCAVQLPGRESRMGEDPIDDMGVLLDGLAPAVVEVLDRPFALYGHSMGARVAFELSRRLRRMGAPAPRHLFVSGCPAPQLPQPPPLHPLPEAELVRRLRELGGLPPEVFEIPGVLDVLLPVMRADFAVVENCAYEPEPPLDHPVTAFCGTTDPEADLAQTAAWQAQTSAAFAAHEVPGGHFFVQDRRADVLAVIVKALSTDS
ncbi:medium-chain acyl-[acyl-carrier-protein] hydrolase [Nonomuraea solani]|uniref:Medium-chain acyl-[acyl-carrier-protein] hydrolase n=1 Tax=Nonomuraea solani TaxID=1144553 RepID=A0A1H6EWP9_9ACTN|nr:alpha/beta fold hydrolase [Nonomuraea solani]SEH01843.1 medium-chain acyl-[acyl-carrier-protein] hydrolase [Nonomuraea solani]